MRYSEGQVTSEFLDQPTFAGEAKKQFICSTPRSGSYLLCRYMINAGLEVPHEYFNPINMRQIAPRLGLGAAVEGLEWHRRSPMDRLPFGFRFVVALADRLGISPSVLRRWYSELRESIRSDPTLPQKAEIARNYLRAKRYKALPPANRAGRTLPQCRPNPR